MALDPREGLFEFHSFTGLRNTTDRRDFGPGDLEVALNVDIDRGQNISRRFGYSAPVTAAVDRGLFAAGSTCLGIGSNALKLIAADYSLTTLHSGLTPGLDMAYAAVGDRVYYANGAENGVVQNGARRSWGLAVPALPSAAEAGGSLQAGRYQFALTYWRNDGQESGASLAGMIELTSVGGIQLSNTPVSADPTVDYVAIYVSDPNGSALFRAGVVPNGTTTFTLQDPHLYDAPLLTQFLAPPPAGSHLGYFRGHMIVAVASSIYPSEPYAPELYDLRKRLPFTARVTLIAPTEGGLWVGTDSQILWLAGKDTANWEFVERANYGAIPGTLAYGDGELLLDGSLRGNPLPFFATTAGLCAGTPAGELLNLTEARYAYPAQPKGAGLVRRHRGVGQYIVTMQGPETAGNVFS